MGATRWSHTVHLGDFWRDEDRTLADKARLTSDRLKWVGRRVSGFAEQDLLDLLFDLTDAGRADDVDQFDRVWAEVYDWADDHRVWIDTHPPAPRLRAPEPESEQEAGT